MSQSKTGKASKRNQFSFHLLLNAVSKFEIEVVFIFYTN